jgi:hypothetical protein
MSGSPGPERSLQGMIMNMDAQHTLTRRFISALGNGFFEG